MGSKIPHVTQPTGVWSLLMSFFVVHQARGDVVGSSGEFTCESYSLKVQGKHYTRKLWKHDLYPNRIFPPKTNMSTKKSSNHNVFRRHVIFRGEQIKFWPKKHQEKQPGHKLRHMFKQARGHKFCWLTAFSHPIMCVWYQKTYSKFAWLLGTKEYTT